MVLLRSLVGDALRQVRQRQRRTLRDVSAEARVSLGYLSEVERGQKEPSSELLASICSALGMPLSDLLEGAAAEAARREPPRAPISTTVPRVAITVPTLVVPNTIPAGMPPLKAVGSDEPHRAVAAA